MPTYIALSTFTDQGVRNAKDTTKRAESVMALGKKVGATMTQVYWTLGKYDVVAIIEAPNDETATAFSLGIGSLGNIRTQTMRAFSKDEMGAILSKLG
jgi:uncharacterized protein with GYD domain